ncbi:hypothetical protein Cni_G18781 [Canna indica]|uniref:PAS domain-containing protein n=1 Tax=Canna indica TaxID=4628 RepID=A0AAQ3KLQ3_9LILI|nr:hypothetical protein Cni_G18781 [Canna indica]
MGGSLEELVKRFHDLEVSQARLRDQIRVILEEGRGGGRERGVVIPGRFAHGPFFSVLKHIGHALHIYRPHTGEIIFWNKSAENLYGWRDYDALGRRIGDLLHHEENSNPCLRNVMERLNRGQSWSGRLPYKKKSGEMPMAMVTKSPLYEDGVFVGVITVSSDAALLLMTEHLDTFRHQNNACKQGKIEIQLRKNPDFLK